MSKSIRPQLTEQAQRYAERAMELGGYQNLTDFVNAAIMIAYQHLVEQQLSAAGEWESKNAEQMKAQAEEMERLQVEGADEQALAAKGVAVG